MDYYHKMMKLQRVLIIIVFTHIHLCPADRMVNTTCLNVPENNCYRPAFTTSETTCEGWICWESQLTLSTKRFIVTTLNQFRNAEARNVTNMNKLVWHWMLEQEAIRAAATCERKFLEHYNERRNIPGLGYSLLCENGCIYREEMVFAVQSLFKQLFYSFLSEGGVSHSFRGFSNEESFRRANAEFFGCSLVVIRSIVAESYVNVFAFVCVFCTTNAEWSTVYSNNTAQPCHPPRVRGEDTRYPHLCASWKQRNIFLCEPDNPCPHDRKTEMWQTEFEGLASRLSYIQTSIGPLLLVNESSTQVSRLDDGTPTFVTTVRPYVDTEGEFLKFLQIYPPLPKSVLFHPPHKAVIFNDILNTLVGPNVSFIYPEDPDVCEVVTPAAATMGTTDAFCCFYLMLATLLTTIILCGLIAYSVDHYRKKIQ